MDTVHLRGATLPRGQDGAEERFLALAAWLGQQRDEVSSALSSVRQVDGVRWESAAGAAFRAALEERRRGLVRANGALEAARSALVLQAAWLASLRCGPSAEPVRRPGTVSSGHAGPSVHYEGR